MRTPKRRCVNQHLCAPRKKPRLTLGGGRGDTGLMPAALNAFRLDTDAGTLRVVLDWPPKGASWQYRRYIHQNTVRMKPSAHETDPPCRVAKGFRSLFGLPYHVYPGDRGIWRGPLIVHGAAHQKTIRF